MARRLGGTFAAAFLGLLLVFAGACATTMRATIGSLHGLRPGYGRLSGSVGPGAPPNGTIPNLTLTFSNGATTFQATVTAGKYQIDLPAGTWDVRSPDGVCATGLSVAAGTWQSDDLGYPIGGCQSFGAPSTPNQP